jgi:predicted PurR-regulated permease PerM
MQRWLSGQVLLMLAHGASALAVFWALHLRFFYVLAVFAGLINIIPVVGPILTVIVAGTVAAISSLGKLVGVVIFFTVYHNVENILLTPRIMKAKLRIPASTVIAALIIGDVLAGFIGMLLAVPFAVMVSAFLDEYVISSGPPAAVNARVGMDARMSKIG